MIPHHNSDPTPISGAEKRMLEEFLGKAQREWPDKRVSGDDDGVTAFAIAVDPVHKIIRIQFTKPVNWIGLDLETAENLNLLLAEKIRDLKHLA